MAKLTVSLSQAARKRVDGRAAALGVTLSAYVERLIAKDEQSELEALLEEGYRAVAAQNLEFAECAAPLAWEVVRHDDSAW